MEIRTASETRADLYRSEQAERCGRIMSKDACHLLLDVFPGVVGTAYQRAGLDMTKAQTQRLFP